jgi:hypothetical protein
MARHNDNAQHLPSEPYSDMLEPFEEPGYWWVPGNESDKTAGTLSYNPTQGLTLKLLGTLLDRSHFHESEQLPLVLGYLIRGKEVSLFGCLLSHASEHFPGYATSGYDPSSVLFGWHFESEEHAKFDEVYVRVFNGEECIDISAVSREYLFEKETQFKGYRLEYKQPEAISCPLGAGSVGITWSLGVTGDYSFNTEISQAVSLRVKCPEPMLYTDILKGPYSVIHSLLEVAADQHLPYRSVECYSPACVVQDSEGKDRQAEVSVVWDQHAALCSAGARKKPHQMMFTLGSFKDRLPQFVARWDAFRQKHHSTAETYSMLLRHRRQLPWEHYFLSLVYALESYHRRCFVSSGRISLEKRIVDLCELLPASVMPLLGDKLEFSSKVAVTRNFFAHQDDSLKGRALESWRLYLCILRLDVVLRSVVLKELGFADSEIEEMFNRLQYWQQIHNVGQGS